MIIRGNSGSGKSSIARAVREQYGRGCALIEQDYLRRILLREWDGRHSGETYAFYLDVSFDETVHRHATRPQATEFTPEQMSEWYEHHDVLGIDGEHVIPESSMFAESVEFIARTSGLVAARV